MSPTQHTLKKLRKEGYTLVEVTERWHQFARVRKDLFGFIDVLAIRGNEVLAVQATSGSHVSARFAKMAELPAVGLWLASGTRRLMIHGWAKAGPAGKRKLWTCREIELAQDAEGRLTKVNELLQRA